MKKLFLFLLIFLFAEVTFGQFDFGLKLGYNANKLSSNIDSIKSNINSGFQVGAFFRIGKRIFIQPEVYYTLSGAIVQKDISSSLSNWKQKITVGTLDIPVLVGFKIINAKIFNWHVLLGPQASFVVNSKIKDMNTVTGPVATSDLSKVNWYVQVGTGIDVLFLVLDIKYQIGLNRVISSVTSNNVVYDINSKNNMFVVSLGFKIL